MKNQFIVTIEGAWIQGDGRATRADVEKKLREVVKDGFEFLADRVTVKRHAESIGKRNRDTNPDAMSDAEVFADKLAGM